MANSGGKNHKRPNKKTNGSVSSVSVIPPPITSTPVTPRVAPPEDTPSTGIPAPSNTAPISTFSTSRVESVSRNDSPSIVPRKQDVCEACLSEFDDTETERPRHNITTFCPHPPNFCISCLSMYIRSMVKESTNGVVPCPGSDTYGCEEELSPNEIRTWADEATYEEHDNIMLREALKAQEGFIHCPYKDKDNPSKQCQGGHIHEEGGGNYILCPKCEQPYCAKHKVAWHHEESCDDYDNRSQSGYRTVLDQAREELETHTRRINRSSEDAAITLTLRQAGESVRQRNDEAARRELRRADEIKRQIDERRYQEEKERRERDEKSVKGREERVNEAQKRRKENRESEVAVDRSSKPCPACGCPTQKTMGCDTIHCVARVNPGGGKFRTGNCSTEWCWRCGKEIAGYSAPGPDGHWLPRGCGCKLTAPPGFGLLRFDRGFDPRFGGGRGFGGGFYRNR